MLGGAEEGAMLDWRLSFGATVFPKALAVTGMGSMLAGSLHHGSQDIESCKP